MCGDAIIWLPGCRLYAGVVTYIRGVFVAWHGLSGEYHVGGVECDDGVGDGANVAIGRDDADDVAVQGVGEIVVLGDAVIGDDAAAIAVEVEVHRVFGLHAVHDVFGGLPVADKQLCVVCGVAAAGGDFGESEAEGAGEAVHLAVVRDNQGAGVHAFDGHDQIIGGVAVMPDGHHNKLVVALPCVGAVIGVVLYDGAIAFDGERHTDRHCHAVQRDLCGAPRAIHQALVDGGGGGAGVVFTGDECHQAEG